MLLVLMFHAGAADFGWLGVQIFFVLSGFLITTVLLRERHLPLRRYLVAFYARRALRILPLYLTVVALLLVSWKVCGVPGGVERAWPSLVTYTYNLVWFALPTSTWYMHFWSLCIEEQFYLVWPLVVFFAPPRWLGLVSIALVCLGPIVRAALGLALPLLGIRQGVGPLVLFFTGSHVDAFAWGALAVLFGRRVPRPAALFAAAFAITLACGLVNQIHHLGAGLATILAAGFPIATTAGLQHVWGYSLLNLTTALLLAWISQDGGRALTNTGLMSLGRISYGAYVIHPLVLGALLESRLAATTSPVLFGARLILYLLLTALLALASFRFLETPFMALRARFAIDRPVPAL